MRRLTSAVSATSAAIRSFSSVSALLVLQPPRCDTNAGTKVTITTPPFLGSRCRIESGTLRGCSVSARAEEWEKMTGACGHVERVAHGRGRHVGEVHQHAEAVHLAHHLAAEVGEAVVPGAVERGIGPVEGHVVGEGHVARAEIVVGAQRAERVLDGVAALHAEQRGDPAALELALDVGCGERQGQPLGVAGDRTGGRCRTAPAGSARSRCP